MSYSGYFSGAWHFAVDGKDMIPPIAALIVWLGSLAVIIFTGNKKGKKKEWESLGRKAIKGVAALLVTVALLIHYGSFKKTQTLTRRIEALEGKSLLRIEEQTIDPRTPTIHWYAGRRMKMFSVEVVNTSLSQSVQSVEVKVVSVNGGKPLRGEFPLLYANNGDFKAQFDDPVKSKLLTEGAREYVLVLVELETEPQSGKYGCFLVPPVGKLSWNGFDYEEGRNSLPLRWEVQAFGSGSRPSSREEIRITRSANGEVLSFSSEKK